MEKLKKWSTSIVAIIIAFWLFFPLGFVLVYIRLKDKHGKYYAITKELFWTGLIWTGFGLLYLGLSITERNFISEYFPAGIFVFVIPGAICFFFGNKRNNKMKVYDKYMTYISSRKKVKIDGVCNSVGVDYDTGLKMLEEMISKGFIDGYLEDDELIMKKIEETAKGLIDDEVQYKETKVVKCKECGAKNTVIIGQAKECEYCGSKLI